MNTTSKTAFATALALAASLALPAIASAATPAGATKAPSLLDGFDAKLIARRGADDGKPRGNDDGANHT